MPGMKTAVSAIDGIHQAEAADGFTPATRLGGPRFESGVRLWLSLSDVRDRNDPGQDRGVAANVSALLYRTQDGEKR